jgi:hypothetical protein
MNYERIHDNIILRAKTRSLPKKVYTEKHHIIPICEGGPIDGPTVKLTLKEHRIIHILRYKMTGILGNSYAYRMMRGSSRKDAASFAARMSHAKRKENDLRSYKIFQKEAGIKGGISSYKNTKGFHSLSDESLKKARDRGRKTIVENKLGMFSDEYRKIHKELLKKKIVTPDGVFHSMTDVAVYYGISNASVTYRIKSSSKKFAEWKYLEKGN